MTNNEFEFYCRWRARVVSDYDNNTYADHVDIQHDIWLERMSLIETAYIKDD